MVTQVVLDKLSGSQKSTQRDECGERTCMESRWVGASIGGRTCMEEGWVGNKHGRKVHKRRG